MEKKEIAASLIGCEKDNLLGYADLGDEVVVIGPDGKKYRFKYDYLAQKEKKMKAAKAPPPKEQVPTKRATKSQATTRKKPTTKAKQ